jgi:hypothetical protein
MVVLVPLDEQSNYESLCRLVEKRVVSEISHGIIVNVATDQEIAGIEIPKSVLAVYHRLGGNCEIACIFSQYEKQGSMGGLTSD